MVYYCICHFIPLEGNTELQGLSSTTFVQLSWQAPSHSDIPFEYEVAYAIDPDCSGDLVSLPDEHTVYSLRTMSETIKVFGLVSNRCYVFGVRAYESVSGFFGDYSIINGAIVSVCNITLQENGIFVLVLVILDK